MFSAIHEVVESIGTVVRGINALLSLSLMAIFTLDGKFNTLPNAIVSYVGFIASPVFVLGWISSGYDKTYEAFGRITALLLSICFPGFHLPG